MPPRGQSRKRSNAASDGTSKRLKKERIAVWLKGKERKQYCALNGKIFEGREAFVEYRRDKTLLEKFSPAERKTIRQSNGVSRKELREKLAQIVKEAGVEFADVDTSIEIKSFDDSFPVGDLRRWMGPEVGSLYSKHGFTTLRKWQEELLQKVHPSSPNLSCVFVIMNWFLQNPILPFPF